MFLVLQQLPSSENDGTYQYTPLSSSFSPRSLFFSLFPLSREIAPPPLFHSLFTLIFSKRAVPSEFSSRTSRCWRFRRNHKTAPSKYASANWLLDVFLLVLQALPYSSKISMDIAGVEGHSPSHVDQSLANVSRPISWITSDLVVVATSSQGAKEIDGLTVEASPRSERPPHRHHQPWRYRWQYQHDLRRSGPSRTCPYDHHEPTERTRWRNRYRWR